VAYFDGASVLFDDNATGPTAVNIAALVSPASVTVSNSALNYAFSGSGVGGGSSLTKYGTGTLLFTNSGNTFIGDVTINAGTVQFGAGGTSGTLPATGDITDNGNLVLNHSNNQTLPNVISGSGVLAQSGSNVLTVTGSNSFSGTTVVNAGTLVLNGVLSGTLTNAPGATIGGNGTNVGAVMVSGAIRPSASTGTPSTFTSGDLDLSTGATLTFSLNGSDSTPGSGVNDLLQVGGNFNANNNQVTVSFAGVPQTGVPYTLVNFSGTQNGSLSSTVAGTHFGASLSQNSSPVTVTLSGSGANLKWDCATNGIWDMGATTNWLNGASLDFFYAGDNVLFDDTPGVGTNVTVAAVVYPNVITVNSANNNFTIAGRISGPARIQKLGSSTLTLSSGANDFSGGTVVAAGTLRLGANGASGNGTTYVTNGATLDLNASTMGASAVISGSGMGGRGAVVNNGFILNGNQHAFDAGTTLFLAGNASIGASNRWDIRNGSLSSFDANPWNLTLVGPNDFHLVNATVDSQLGNVDVQGGRFVIETTTLQDSPGWASDATHSITVESGAELSLSPSSAAALGRTITLMNNSTVENTGGNSVINGPFTLQGNGTFSVTSGTLEIDSAVAGSGTLTLSNGLLKLTGLNTYTNSTLINAGTLSLTDTASISNSVYVNVAAGAAIDVSLRTDGTLTLGTGQTLQGNGRVSGNLAVGPGSTVSPGASLSSIGALSVTNTTTLTGTTLMKINATTGAADELICTNGIACGGTIIVTNLAGTITNGQTFQLLFSTNITGAFGPVILPSAPGLTWTNNLTTSGTLTAGVASGPTPQPYITSVILSGTNLIIHGTNGQAGEQFDVLASTNVAAPLSTWTSINSGTFSGSSFSITNAVTTGTPKQFFILRIP
jgi:autotransporter-associated beta strand protein